MVAWTPPLIAAGKEPRMRNIQIQITFGFLLLVGLFLAVQGFSKQLTECGLASRLTEELGVNNIEAELRISETLRKVYTQRAVFVTNCGVVIAVAAAYGLGVSSIRRP